MKAITGTELVNKLLTDSKNSNIKEPGIFDISKGISPEFEYFRPQTTNFLTPIINFVQNQGSRKHVIIQGPKGSGKTSIVNFYLEKLKTATSSEMFYVNCKVHKNSYNIKKAVLNNRKRSDRFIVNADFESKMIKGKYKILILDECDEMIDDVLLYEISRNMPKVVLVMIVRNPKYFENISDDVQSSLITEFLNFPSYDAVELHTIFKKRAEAGLKNFDDDILQTIASINCRKFQADARIGISVLEKIFYDPSNFIKDNDEITQIMQEQCYALEVHSLRGMDSQLFYILFVMYKLGLKHQHILTNFVETDFIRKTGLSKSRFRQMVISLQNQGLVERSKVQVGKNNNTRMVPVLLLNLEDNVKSKINSLATERGMY